MKLHNKCNTRITVEIKDSLISCMDIIRFCGAKIKSIRVANNDEMIEGKADDRMIIIKILV